MRHEEDVQISSLWEWHNGSIGLHFWQRLWDLSWMRRAFFSVVESNKVSIWRTT